MQWVGRFLGYCVWTGEAVNMPLLPSVYSYLLGNDDVHWRDLMLDAPQKYKNYMMMLSMPPDEIEMVMMLDMTIDDYTGNEFPLVDGGETISVTGDNVSEFVRLASLASMRGIHKDGLDVLRTGFNEIMDQETLHFIQSQQITWCELQLIVNGVAEVDVVALQQATVYRNCNMGADKCKWFFEVLKGWQLGEPMCDLAGVREALDQERVAAQQAGRQPFGKCAKLVLGVFEFATGTDRAPAGGYRNLLDKAGNKCPFTIYSKEGGRNQPPEAHTCFNKLDLPDYDSREKLAEQLYIAIVFGMGFATA
jgi:hypothetical protein